MNGRTLRVALPGREYDIEIRRGALGSLPAKCRELMPKAERVFAVTDETVGGIYGGRAVSSLEAAGYKVCLHVVPAGEESKSPEKLVEIWEAMAAFGFTRSDAVVALGGGVVGDLAGFAAATVLRGVNFIQVPTTLLAQVDSSVGGKVGIDLKAGKNLAGAFWQPKGVLIDPDCLETLSDGTFSDGMAEVIKYGCIRDAALFRRLAALGGRDGVMSEIEDVIYTCCDIKRSLVMEDERDTGARMILNFGHTLGHAYELAGGYKRWTHGQAVAAGMVSAARIGTALGATPRETETQIREMLEQYKLPEKIECPFEIMREAVSLDKKSSGSSVRLILLKALGEAEIFPIERERLLALAEDAR